MNARVEPSRAGLAILSVFALVVAMMMVLSGTPAGAEGAGSPDACKTGIQAGGDADLRTYTAPSGQIVEGVCIKSGNNMFLPDNHSGVLDNGTYENGCYQVSGVGTRTVTVERIGTPGPFCQALSHVDVLQTPAATTTTTSTTTTTTSTTTTTTIADTSATTVAETGTTVGDEVLGTVVTTSTVADEVLDTEVEAEELPFTGVDSGLLIGLAVLLLMSGLVVLHVTGDREEN